MAIIKTNSLTEDDFGLKHVVTLEGSRYYKSVDGKETEITKEKFYQIVYNQIDGQEINFEWSLY